MLWFFPHRGYLTGWLVSSREFIAYQPLSLFDAKFCFYTHAAIVSILLYGCTTWTLTKRLEKKLDGNYTRMLRAILNKSWRQYPTRHQLYGHLPPITKTIQARRTRHAGHYWRSRDELISDVLLWTPTYGRAKAGRQLEHTYSSYVRIRDVALKTCQRRWTIGRSGERGSGISVQAAQHDDEYIYIYIYIYILYFHIYIYIYIYILLLLLLLFIHNYFVGNIYKQTRVHFFPHSKMVSTISIKHK